MNSIIRENLVTSILIIILVLFGCTSPETSDAVEEIKLEDFKTTIDIQEWDYIPVAPTLYRVSQMAIADGKIFISDNYDTLLHVFSLPEGRLLGNYILKGRGPNELRGANPYGLHAIPPDRVLMAGYNDILILKSTQNSVQVENTVKLPTEFSPINFVFRLNDTSFVWSQMSMRPSTQFESYNPLNKQTSSIVDFPVSS